MGRTLQELIFGEVCGRRIQTATTSSDAARLPAMEALQGATADSSCCAGPALPAKQRRSQHSSACSVSDLQLEGRTCNPSDSSSQTSSFTDVFVAPTDCHAVQCPIHQHGPSGHHKVRFFSDEIPPPIPKKRLVRTLSLPAVKQYSPAQRPIGLQHCANSHYDGEVSPVRHAGEGKKEPALDTRCLNQLNFETPDQKLPDVFGSFCHHEQVCAGIQDCYLQFMKTTVRYLETMVFLEEQEVEMVKRLQPEDCMLPENDQPKTTEEEIFFTVNFPKVPTWCLSAKVNRKGSELKYLKPLPHHPNTEEIIAHFPPCMTKEKLQPSELLASIEQSQEGSTEPSNSTTKGCTLVSFLERGFTVTIVRDLPWGTLEDFVQGGVSLHRSHPDVYERRLGLLMLQLVQGLCHLRSHDVKHTELRPQSIKLVWWSTKNKGLAEKAKAPTEPKDAMRSHCLLRRGYADKSEALDDVFYENVCTRKVHVLWGKRGTPRAVISHDAVQAQCTRDVPSPELLLGRLLKHCLHNYADMQQSTQYTPGLRYLIQQLTGATPGLQLTDTARVLQAVLWGPRAGLFEENQASAVTVQNWLMVKRSLLVLKLAEKGLLLNQHELDWEDYLCLQYLSSADPETILGTAVQLGFHKPVNFNDFNDNYQC